MNWEQLRAILWLRGRLTWNAFCKGGTLNAIVAVIFMASFIIGVIGSAVAGFLVGLFALANQKPQVLLAVWDGIVMVFVIVWLIALITEIQRSESIDLTKLLHLPLSLKQVFVFNYIASHVAPAILLLVPAMLTMGLGLVFSTGARMALMAPLAVSFVFMITAWTYCLRGWLAALMVNKRRRRAVVVWITLGFVLLSQLPAVILNSGLIQGNSRRDQPSAASNWRSQTERQDGLSRLVEAHLVVPVGWPGYAAMTLKQNTLWPALGATAVCCMVGSLGLTRSYRTTLRFYQGVSERSSVPRSIEKTKRARGVLLVERQLPWLSEDTAALALASFRSLLRAPELKMSLIMPIVAGAGISSLLFRSIKYVANHSLAGFASTVAAVLAVFSFAPLMGNVFGLDRDGFRQLVLLPTRRDHILLAKNLAFFPFVGGVGLTLLILVGLVLRVPWSTSVTGLVQIGIVFLLFSLMCNLVATMTPYRLTPGTLQAKKPKPVVFLAIGITMLVMPIFLLPAFIPPALQLASSLIFTIPAWFPVNLVSAVLILLAVFWLYRALLPAEGRLLQRREMHVLREVTEELQ